MSGAEVAGFLLAGPPILVSWLEHYRDVFEMLGCWRRFRSAYRKAETQLQSLELSFNLTLEKLFLPHVESLEKLEQLKTDWKNKVWTDAEENLRQRLLPEVHSVYASLLEDLHDSMGELEKELGYDKQKFQHELNKNKAPAAGTPQRVSIVSRPLYELERAKFSTREKPREAAISKVEHILERLQRLLVQNDEVATHRASYMAKSKAAVQSTLLHFWRHAHAVYNLLTQRWSCGCRQQHRADLLLFHRTAPEVTLDLWFHYALPIPDTCPWTALPAQISQVELPSEPKTQTPAKVRFALAKDSKGAASSELSPINDLCRAFMKVKAGKRPVGLLSEQGSDSRYSVVKPEQTKPDMITLGSLLRRNTWERPQRKQRYRIAATIASSHLQLHSSGWLKEGWSKDDILFPLSSQEPDFDKMYLRKGFENSPSKANDVSFDIAFLTLGILLLELCFGYTLEESPFRQKYLLPDGSSDLVQDRMAAWDWAERVAGEADERWAHAIDWCLGKWKVREGDNTWRQDFYQAVVEPLRAEAAPN